MYNCNHFLTHQFKQYILFSVQESKHIFWLRNNKMTLFCCGVLINSSYSINPDKQFFLAKSCKFFLSSLNMCLGLSAESSPSKPINHSWLDMALLLLFTRKRLPRVTCEEARKTATRGDSGLGLPSLGENWSASCGALLSKSFNLASNFELNELPRY